MLRAVVDATRWLEDDPRFNAGTGSNVRFDGVTIQMDAACMTSAGEFGAVAAIEAVKNPIEIAHSVLSGPHILLVGDGASIFARRLGHPVHDPSTEEARQRWRDVVSGAGPMGDWTRAELEAAWNFDTPLREVLGSDTVGAVAWDGKEFAGALSSGGTTTVLRGRVGDVPLPGCGLYAGDHGAVALTGDGEHFARSMLAYRAHAQLGRGASPREVVDWTLSQLSEGIDVGLIVVDRTTYAGGARHGMAWFGTHAEI